MNQYCKMKSFKEMFSSHKQMTLECYVGDKSALLDAGLNSFFSNRFRVETQSHFDYYFPVNNFYKC